VNNKQKQIFRKLAELFSKYDLDDVKIALSAFRDDDLLNEVAESASRTQRATKRTTKKSVTKKRSQPRERLTEIEREVSLNDSKDQSYALLVAKKLLDRQAFSGAPLIRSIFDDLDVEVGKSVSDRNQLVILLYSHLKNEKIDRITAVEQKLDEYSSQTSSLSDWSKLINRKDDNSG
jgi:hypothetical protein